MIGAGLVVQVPWADEIDVGPVISKFVSDGCGLGNIDISFGCCGGKECSRILVCGAEISNVFTSVRFGDGRLVDDGVGDLTVDVGVFSLYSL